MHALHLLLSLTTPTTSFHYRTQPSKELNLNSDTANVYSE